MVNSNHVRNLSSFLDSEFSQIKTQEVHKKENLVNKKWTLNHQQSIFTDATFYRNILVNSIGSNIHPLRI